MKKGFTLIELLAVILILGIIALIAVPAVSNIVEDAKKGATEQSVNQFINAIDKQIAINQMNSDPTDDINDGTYDIPLDSKYRVKLKGQTPTDGWVKIEDGNVSEYSLVIGDYTVSYDGTNKTITEGNVQKLGPAVVYRLSSDFLFIGDKIDLVNKTITNYTKFNYIGNKDHIDVPTNEDFINVPTDKTKPMTGIYSTNIDDVLTVSIKPDGTPVGSKNNINYLKHTIDEYGIITKTELCNITSWGTLCRESYATYNEETKKWINNKYEEQVVELSNFYKGDSKTSTSAYEGVTDMNGTYGTDTGQTGFSVRYFVGSDSAVVYDNGYIDARGSFSCEIYYGASSCW